MSGNYSIILDSVGDKLIIPIQRSNTLGIAVSGTFNGTVVFKGSKDKGLTWETVFVYPYNSSTGGYGTAVSQTTSVGSYVFPTAGYGTFKVESSVLTSGIVNVVASATEGTLVTAPTSSGGGTTTNNTTNNIVQSDSINILGNTRITLTTTTTGSQTSVLASGIYHVNSTVDCSIKVDTVANDVTTSNGYQLFADNVVPLTIPTGGNYKVGVISLTTGTVSLFKVS